MRNVCVSTEKGIGINKRLVHKIVSLITSELELKIESLEFNFVLSETLLAINKRHLKHNYYTDIITFDYSVERNNLDGEIFISVQDAAENSKKYHIPLDNELLRLIAHGILHLIGFDDTTTAKRKKMKEVEDKLVFKFQKNSKGLTNKA